MVWRRGYRKTGAWAGSQVGGLLQECGWGDEGEKIQKMGCVKLGVTGLLVISYGVRERQLFDTYWTYH
jgi:hypothetical protein